MNVFIVRSYDSDQQQSFSDVVPAKDADDANQKVSAFRHYAVVTEVSALKDEMEFFEGLKTLTLEKAKSDWDELLGEDSQVECPICGLTHNVDEPCDCEEEDLPEQPTRRWPFA